MLIYTAIAALVCAYGTMVLGSYVSATGLGLTCVDWPLCRGNILPNEEIIVEWIHRFFALLTTIFIIATLVLALKSNDKKIKITVSLATLFVFIQITLGVIVLDSRLHPTIVATHLGVATLVFTSILLTIVRANRLNREKSIIH